MRQPWPSVPLGEVLIERQEQPSQDDLLLGRVKIVEKISFESGRIQLRANGETKTGMILARPGDLVVSGINAAKGAIAVYGEENTEPIAATIHYGAYVPNRERVSVDFLWWLLRSRIFKDLLQEYVPGGIKTELKAKRFLPVPIPLPSLTEQQRITSTLRSVTQKIQEARALRKHAMEEAQALPVVLLRQITAGTDHSGILGSVLTALPRNGWSASCDNAEGGTAVLSLGAVTGFTYKPHEFKRTSLETTKNAHYWLNVGDLLITRSNSPELVGHAAIYDGNPVPCIYPDLMMKVQVDPKLAYKRFVWYWLQSPVVREYIAKNAKGTSPTMKKISQGIVNEIPFPTSLTVKEQERIVAELDTLQAHVGTLKRTQVETAAELDALLPAILDKAFRGNL